MSVLQDILEWSTERPSWQRDALRRFVTSGDLTDEDIQALTEICKSAHGLSEQTPEAIPLAKEHVPEGATGIAPVSLVSIFHHRGANALAENQTLKFSSGLTVVYGDNGAGKTGYIRILKSACRARGREEILGNVVSGTTPLSPIVSIKYKVGGEPEPREWRGGNEDEHVSRASVFDTQSAAVYLSERTDVAFRPFGLDLFDKLVRACKRVRGRLEVEQRSLSASALGAVQGQIPADTVAGKFVANLSSLTKPDTLSSLAHLAQEEEVRLALLEKSLLDLQANDPQKLVRQLTLREGRVQALVRHLLEVEATLSDDAVRAVFEARAEGRRKREEAKRLREATFPSGLLAGTGAESWMVLWEAARHFSQEHAYPDRQFPVVGDGAQCVLCQQGLDNSAAHRLEQFEAFVASTTERELRQIRETFARLRKTFADLKTTTEAIDETLGELRIDHEAEADAITNALAANERRRVAVVQALGEDRDLAVDFPSLVAVAEKAKAIAKQIDDRIGTLRTNANAEERKRMAAEAQELRARKILATHGQAVLDDIERRKKFAAYGLCIDDTKTNAITQKSTSVTKEVISQKLKQSFQDELSNLAFRHVEVELSEAGGSEGILYHKLILKRAPGVELPKVVSEGEQRCLSIAAFFAELSTADDQSGIVFDDPISSLDYMWRKQVARRLVGESKKRQVIVFTHDIYFLMQLRRYAEEMDVEALGQHIRNFAAIGAGVCAEELPWPALSVNKKIGFLRKSWQAADKLFREGHQEAYEEDAKKLYGYLREAWERAVEQMLLNGVVERFGSEVHTKQLAQIADITPDDCRTVVVAMTKCSECMRGHDQAAGARTPVPEPAELKDDIQLLDDWVTAIKKRRN